jgi:SynChlorMet cassette radical SAM/SPASM protein ScmF
MGLYKKNPEYSYHHIEGETGYSLLYSKSTDNCVILDPVATALWKASGDTIDSDLTSEEFAKVFNTENAVQYMQRTVQKLYAAGILDTQSGPDEPRITADCTSFGDYTLDTINYYITDECNCRCYHCYQPTKTVKSTIHIAPPGQLSHRTFLRFVQQALPLGLKDIKITGGEPLLRDDIEELIKGIRHLGVGVSIETNGFLLTEKLAELLAQNVKLAALSLDGGSAALHDRLRRRPGSFDRAIQSMRMLSSRGCKVQAIMSVSRLNVAEIDSAIARAAENGCSSFKVNIVVTLGDASWLENSEILLKISEMLDLSRSLRKLEAKHKIPVFLDGPPCFASIRDAFTNGVGACRFTNLLGVLSNGAISYCGIGNSCPELVFGNILDDGFDLQRFWLEAKPLQLARKVLSNKLDGVCQHCVFEASCKGSCRAFAYSQYKSLQKPHPWCQEAFDKGLFPSYLLIKDRRQEVTAQGS